MPPAGAGREIVVIPGADHGLKRATGTVAGAVVDFVTSADRACQGRTVTSATCVRAPATCCSTSAPTTPPRARRFVWPRPEHFNFAIDWFDGVLAAEHPHHAALRLIEADGSEACLHLRRPVRAFGPARRLAARRGCRAAGRAVLVLLGNQVELWETTLAAMKLGAVIIPATTLLAEADLRDRIDRGDVGAVIARSELAPRFEDVPRVVPAHRRRRAGPGLAALRGQRAQLRAVRPRRPDPRRRPAAAVLHLGHHRVAQAGRAHPRQLPDRTPVDDVLDRPAARRRPPQRVEPGLGEARLVVRVRAVARRRHHLPVQLRTLRRRGDARRAARREGDDVLRAADGVADADPAGPRRVAGPARRCARSSAPASRSTPR